MSRDIAFVMTNMVKIVVAAFVFCTLFSTDADAEVYHNERFGFSVDILSDKYFPHEPPGNNDGRRFEANDNSGVTVAFYARYNVFFSMSVDSLLSLKENSRILDIEYTPTYFRVLYELDGKRLLYHDILKGGTIYTASFEAPVGVFDRYRTDFEKMRASWRLGFEAAYE